MSLSSKRGIPLAVFDGRLVTEKRTAAVSAAVTKYLAPDDSRVLTLVGSGVRADAHLEALRRVCSFEKVRSWSRTTDHPLRFARLHIAKVMIYRKAIRRGGSSGQYAIA